MVEIIVLLHSLKFGAKLAHTDVKTIKHSHLLHYSSEVLKETQNSKNTSLFYFIVYVASHAFLGVTGM